MDFDAGSCTLRRWRSSDRERLAEIADDRRIWRNMTELFPNPYTLDDADEWIARCAGEGEPPLNLAIVINSDISGGIGAHLRTGEQRHVANVGYWLSPDAWGRGIATDALRCFTDYFFDAFPVRRLDATVFGWNPASAKVLEKCGYRFEGRLRDAIVKDGDTTDLIYHGLLRRDH